jgi:hypothetical protein
MGNQDGLSFRITYFAIAVSVPRDSSEMIDSGDPPKKKHSAAVTQKKPTSQNPIATWLGTSMLRTAYPRISGRESSPDDVTHSTLVTGPAGLSGDPIPRATSLWAKQTADKVRRSACETIRRPYAWNGSGGRFALGSI